MLHDTHTHQRTAGSSLQNYRLCESLNFLFGAIVALLSAVDTVYAAPAVMPAPAQELVAQVLQQNAGLAALRSAVDAAESRTLSAGSLPDPKLLGAVAPRTLNGFTTPSGQERGVSGILALSQEIP